MTREIENHRREVIGYEFEKIVNNVERPIFYLQLFVCDSSQKKKVVQTHRGLDKGLKRFEFKNNN